MPTRHSKSNINQQTKHKSERPTLEVSGPVPLGRKIYQQARLLSRGANPRSRLILLLRSRSSLMPLVPHAKTSRLISRSILSGVRTRLSDARCWVQVHTFFVCPRVGVSPLNKFLVYPSQHPNGRVRETISQSLWTSRLHRVISMALCMKGFVER